MTTAPETVETDGRIRAEMVPHEAGSRWSLYLTLGGRLLQLEGRSPELSVVVIGSDVGGLPMLIMTEEVRPHIVAALEAVLEAMRGAA